MYFFEKDEKDVKVVSLINKINSHYSYFLTFCLSYYLKLLSHLNIAITIIDFIFLNWDQLD